MEFHFCGTADAASARVAQIIIDQLNQKPASVLALPTGGSPLLVYAELRRAFMAGQVSFKSATTFNLDEYVGIGGAHPSSYASYMRDALFDHIDCPPDHRHIPDGAAIDPDREAADYEQKIATAGGIDLLFLGIGRNGHIAFNEPGSSHTSRTRVVALAAETMDANARFFPTRQAVPTAAITMGIGTIMAARRIVLLATGTDKAAAVAQSFGTIPTSDYPASALNAHQHCEIVLDGLAAERLAARRR